MQKIQRLVDFIYDELCGAKEYAVEYLDRKATNDPSATKFKEMANVEIGHAITIHDIAVGEINNLKKIYTPPSEMQDVWDKSHRMYVEKVAEIKQYLTM